MRRNKRCTAALVGAKPSAAARSTHGAGSSEALGIDDKYVDVPAIDALKCPATRQPAVYALALGVATMVVGWRMLVAGAVFYVLTVRQ